MLEQTDLERMIAVDWDREANDAARFSVNVMTAVNPEKVPAMTLKQCGERFA